MIRMVVQHAPGSIQLLNQNDPRELMGQSQTRQGQTVIGVGDDLRRQTFRAADETDDVGVLAAPSIEVRGQVKSRPLIAAFIERDPIRARGT